MRHPALSSSVPVRGSRQLEITRRRHYSTDVTPSMGAHLHMA